MRLPHFVFILILLGLQTSQIANAASFVDAGGASRTTVSTGKHLELIASLPRIPASNLKRTVEEIVYTLNAITYPDSKPVDPRDAADLGKWTGIWKQEADFWYHTYKTARDTFDALNLRTPERQKAIEGIAHDLMPWMHKWPSQGSWQEALGAYIFFPDLLHVYYKTMWYDNEKVHYAVATAAHYGDPTALSFLHRMVQHLLPEPSDEDEPAEDTSITVTIPGKAGSITRPTQDIVKVFAARTSKAFVVPDACPDLFVEATAAAEKKRTSETKQAVYRSALLPIESNVANIHTIDPRIAAQYSWHHGKRTGLEKVFKAMDADNSPWVRYVKYLQALEGKYSEDWYQKLLACSPLSCRVKSCVSDAFRKNLNLSNGQHKEVKTSYLLALSSTDI